MSVTAGFGYLAKFTLTFLSEVATLAWWATKACCLLAWSAVWWVICLSFIGLTLLYGCGVVSRWGSARRWRDQGNAQNNAGSGARLATVAAVVVLAVAVRHAWVDSDGDGVMELSDFKQQVDTDGDGTVCLGGVHGCE